MHNIENDHFNFIHRFLILFFIQKIDPRYEITKDVRGQIKFLEELDKAEQKRHEEQEREMLMRAAKSRSKTEDPEQAKLKAKVSAFIIIFRMLFTSKNIKYLYAMLQFRQKKCSALKWKSFDNEMPI